MADGRRINSACQETFSRTFWVPGYEWDKVVKLKKKKKSSWKLSEPSGEDREEERLYSDKYDDRRVLSGGGGGAGAGWTGFESRKQAGVGDHVSLWSLQVTSNGRITRCKGRTEGKEIS